MKNTIRDKAIKLLRQEELKNKLEVFDPVDYIKLSQFENRYGISLDHNFKEWLSISNGSHAGGGGFYGIGHSKDSIQLNFVVHPYWILSQWVPVAGDGFGNTYLIDCSRTSIRGFVFFIDSHNNASKITYYVASNFWMFMYLMLVGESDNYPDENEYEDLWPFNKDFVLSIDPAIKNAPYDLLPWNVD